MNPPLRIGLFGKHIRPENKDHFQLLLEELQRQKVVIAAYGDFLDLNEEAFGGRCLSRFTHAQELAEKVDLLISVGGDGTLLDTLPLVRDSAIPIIGLNLGNLGFLTAVHTNFIREGIDALCHQRYAIDQRCLLQVYSPDVDFGDFPYALNDICLFKKEPHSLVRIQAEVDGHFLNTYYGDGLILSTPTGSTAYNLSCGGPILLPDAESFILTPIASHALTVRPLVVPDHCKVELRIEKAEKGGNVSLDSRFFSFSQALRIEIQKAPFSIRTIRLENQHFFDSLREKLIWGKQARK